MSKPFFYRITAADFLAAVVTVPEDDRAAWVLSLALDMVSGDIDKAKSEFAKDIITEAGEYKERRANAGRKGGQAKSSNAKQCLAKPSLPLASSSTEAVTEVKPIVQKKKFNSEQFELFWNTFADKRGRDGAVRSWKKINPNDSLAQEIISGAEMYAKHRVNILAKNGTPKMAQGWLTDKRWEDEDIQVDADLTPQQRQLKEKGYLS